MVFLHSYLLMMFVNLQHYHLIIDFKLKVDEVFIKRISFFAFLWYYYYLLLSLLQAFALILFLIIIFIICKLVDVIKFILLFIKIQSWMLWTILLFIISHLSSWECFKILMIWHLIMSKGKKEKTKGWRWGLLAVEDSKKIYLKIYWRIIIKLCISLTLFQHI